MTKKTERLLVFVFGIIFITAILVLVTIFKDLDKNQVNIFMIVIALASAGVASYIPGSLNIQVGDKLRASGAIVVFILVLSIETKTAIKKPVSNDKSVSKVTEVTDIKTSGACSQASKSFWGCSYVSCNK